MGGVATGVNSRAGGQVPDEGVEPLPCESSWGPRGQVGVHGGDCTEGGSPVGNTQVTAPDRNGSVLDCRMWT